MNEPRKNVSELIIQQEKKDKSKVDEFRSLEKQYQKIDSLKSKYTSNRPEPNKNDYDHKPGRVQTFNISSYG